MSESVGPFCNLKQTVQGTGNGAAVTLNMVEYEREREYPEYVNKCWTYLALMKNIQNWDMPFFVGKDNMYLIS